MATCVDQRMACSGPKVQKNGSAYKRAKNGVAPSANFVDSSLKYRQEVTYALFETETEKIEQVIDNEQSVKSTESCKPTENTRNPKKYKLVWLNITVMAALHLAAGYGFLMLPLANIKTIYWTYLVLWMGTLGVQTGSHRLWAHKTYKANTGVRLLLMLWQTLALQNDIYEWSRDHRGHHKFADTDADPHDSKKGFFFSHVGWLLVKKHPEVIRRGKTLDMTDLERDPIVMFQRRWYIPLVFLLWGAIPTFVPVVLWHENLVVSCSICVFSRYVLSLNLTWLVNSWAHIYGCRPYDTRLDAVEASIRHVLVGEGFHNYHHVFPWDYSASELGAADVFNPATGLINLFHYMGWAWDLKKVTPAMIESKKHKTGNPADFDHYKRGSSALYEYSTGLLTVVGPLLLMLIVNHCVTVTYRPMKLPFIDTDLLYPH